MDATRRAETPDLRSRNRFWSAVRWLTLGVVLGSLSGVMFGRYQHLLVADLGVAESYHVLSHQVSSGEWVIVASRRGGRVQITAVCAYVWESGQLTKGPNSCRLLVGQTLMPSKRPGEWLDIFEQFDELHANQGQGSDQVRQTFSIRSETAVR
jgi:hypothetical protein